MSLCLDVNKGFGEFRLNVSFATEADFVVIHGPSGGGKSTTLKMIAGLERPDRGSIVAGGNLLFDDAEGIDLPARKRQVGYVPQDYALFPHLDVERNVGFGLAKGILGRIERRDQARISELLEVMGLEELKHSPVSTLSGGQRQRVALARALAPRSKLLLLDEPLSALDGPLKKRMRRELRSILKEFSVKMVMVTHDIADVEALADDVVVMRDGSVERTWSLRQLCRRRKVARFVSDHAAPIVGL